MAYGYEQALATTTRDYLLLCLPGNFFNMLFFLLVYYLVAIKHDPPYWINIFLIPVYGLVTYLLTSVYQYPLVGSAVALAFMYGGAALALFIYIAVNCFEIRSEQSKGYI